MVSALLAVEKQPDRAASKMSTLPSANMFHHHLPICTDITELPYTATSSVWITLGVQPICALVPDHGAQFFLTPRLQDTCTCHAAILQMVRARSVPTCLRSSPRCALRSCLVEKCGLLRVGDRRRHITMCLLLLQYVCYIFYRIGELIY
jgi:hypothetical protein